MSAAARRIDSRSAGVRASGSPRSVDLESLAPRGVGDEPVVDDARRSERRRGQVGRQEELDLRRGSQVLAADDVRDAQIAVLDDGGEVVRGEVVASPEDHVADLRADVVGHLRADGRLARRVLVAGIATATRAAARGRSGELAARAAAGVQPEATVGCRRQLGPVVVGAASQGVVGLEVGLIGGAQLPLDAEPLERRKMSRTYSDRYRGASMSSMRRATVPAWAAASQATSCALTALPRCRYPLGVGAMRVIMRQRPAVVPPSPPARTCRRR